MNVASVLRALIFSLCVMPALAQQDIDAELQRSSDEHMREELGVNPITTPRFRKFSSSLKYSVRFRLP